MMGHRHHRNRAAARCAAARQQSKLVVKQRWWSVKRVVLLKTAVLIGLIAVYTLPVWAAVPVSILANGIWLYKL